MLNCQLPLVEATVSQYCVFGAIQNADVGGFKATTTIRSHEHMNIRRTSNGVAISVSLRTPCLHPLTHPFTVIPCELHGNLGWTEQLCAVGLNYPMWSKKFVNKKCPKLLPKLA